MSRILAVAIGWSLVASAGVAAQSAAPAADQAWLGTWEGVFQSDHAPPGPVQVVVTRDSTWHVTMRVQVGAEEYLTVARAVTLVDGVLGWSQEVMGAECRGLATLEGGTMKGQTDCGGGGLQYSLIRVRIPGTPPGGS